MSRNIFGLNVFDLKTQEQTYDIILKQLDNINAILKAGAEGASVSIQNVSFVDLIGLYHQLNAQGCKVQLFLPKEGEETIDVIYRPALGCYINISSEPCRDFKADLSKINLN